MDVWTPDPGTLAVKGVDYQQTPTLPDGNLRLMPLDANATDLLAPDFAEQASGVSLSDLWNKVELAITPESEAEHVVNQIYGYNADGTPITPPNMTLPIPELGTLPHFIAAPITAVKNAVTKAGDTFKDFFVKYAIIGLALIIAAVFVYAFVGAKARKLA